MFRGRASLWFLIVPFVMFVFALPLANRIHPLVFGLPFFTFWIAVSVIATPVSVWLAARYDPLYERPHSTGENLAGAERTERQGEN